MVGIGPSRVAHSATLTAPKRWCHAMKFSYILCDPASDLATLTDRIQRVAALGYDGIELVATHPLGFPIEEVTTAAQRAGLPVVSLLSGWSYANESICLASRDERIRDRAVARLVDYVELAARLGSLVVVGLLQGLRHDEPDPVVANERIVAALARVARVAESRQVPIVIEPVNHLQVGFNHTAKEVAELVDRIGSPAVTLMLDTIHMNIEELAARHDPPIWPTNRPLPFVRVEWRAARQRPHRFPSRAGRAG